MIRYIKKLFIRIALNIRMKLLICFLTVSILSIFTVGYVSVSISTKALHEKIKDNMMRLTSSLASRLEIQIDKYLMITNHLASTIINAINAENELEDTFKMYPYIQHIVYTDISGNILAQYPYNSQLANQVFFSEIPSWKAARDQINITVSSAMTFLEKKSILFIAPVVLAYKTNAPPSLQGLVIVSIPLPVIFESYNNINIYQTGECFVLASNGEFLLKKYYPLDSKKFSDLGKETIYSSIEKNMIDLKSGYASYPLNNNEYLVFFAPISFTKWSLGVNIVKAELTEDIRRLNYLIIGIGLGSIIFCVFISYLLVNIIVKPIVRLTQSAQELEKGNMDVSFTIKSKDEIGILVKAFDYMRHSIKQKIEQLKENEQSLEKTVEKRTIELKETVQALTTSEQRYRGLFNSSKDAIVFLDKELNLINFNHAFCEISGFNRDELLGKRYNVIMGNKWQPNERNLIKQQLAKYGYSQEFELDILRKDGFKSPVSVRVWSIDISADKGFWAIVRDIKERKHVERLKEDVERMVKHDQKTPLNAVIALSGHLLDDKSMTKKQAECLKIINDNGKQMLHMIEHALDIFKMEQGTYDFSPAECDLLEIINKILTDLNSMSLKKSISFKYLMNKAALDWDQPYMVYGEDYLLYVLFSNLIKNAIEASDKNQKVSISINDTENTNEICIHNSGVIPQEIHDTFFERYSTSGKKGGTGIGTYSAYLITKIHGGQISFKTSKNYGTTLFVNLPKCHFMKYKTDINPQTQSEKIASDNRLKSLLIADDSKNNRLIFEFFLQDSAELEVTFASDGAEALELFKSEHFDIVLMDLFMPTMDGYEAVKHIREFEKLERQNKRVPIIATTADSMPDTLALCLNAGFDSMFSKPFTKEKLIELLNKYLKTSVS